MLMPEFETDHFFEKYEFNCPHLLCVSDCESVSVKELFALADLDEELLLQASMAYPETIGDIETRQRIADRYNNVDADDSIMLNAPVEGIYIGLQTLLSQGDEVITLRQNYDALNQTVSQIVGTENVRYLDLIPTASSWDIEPDQLRSFITEKTTVLVLCFPNNPTGYAPTPELFDELLAIAREHNLWIFSDEMYRMLATPEVQLPSVADVYEKSLTLCGLSKSEGLPGIRSGWLLCKDPSVRHQLVNWKFYTSNTPNVLTEVMTNVALQAQSKLLAKNRLIIEENLAAAADFFDKWSEVFVWRSPVAGTVAAVEMKIDSVTDYAHELAQKAGVLILPTMPLGTSDAFWRLGLGRRSFKEALTVFDNYLASEGAPT